MHFGGGFLLSLGALILFCTGIYVGRLTGIIFVDQNIDLQFFGIVAIAGVLTLSLTVVRNTVLANYILSSLAMFYLLVTIFSFPYLNLFLLFLLSFLFILGSLQKSSSHEPSTMKKSLSYSLALLVMMLISGLYRLNLQPQTIGLLVASISDDVRPGGTPLIFSNGIVLFSRYIVLSVSWQVLLLFSLLSALLVENFFMIFRLFTGRATRSVTGSQATGALTVLSCQCESITAALPSIASLILSIAIIPMILESLVFVSLTNIFLRRNTSRGRRSDLIGKIWPLRSGSKFFPLGSIFVIAIPVSYLVGTYFHLERNLFFFGMENFAMYIAGIIIMVMVSLATGRAIMVLSKYSGMLLVLLSTAMMFIWFYPVISYLAVNNGFYFGAMGAISFIGGIMGGIAYTSFNRAGKQIFLEYLSMMFSMFAILIFYVTVLDSFRIWGIFTLTQQLEFSIALWILALPGMWLSTIIVLNDHAVGIEDGKNQIRTGFIHPQ